MPRKTPSPAVEAIDDSNEKNRWGGISPHDQPPENRISKRQSGSVVIRTKV